MSDYKLNLIQSNFRQGPSHLNAYFLPYSVGLLWSYARSRSIILEQWELSELIFKRVDIKTNYKRLADCNVIGFSNYVWNKAHNYKLASAIKEYNPNCMIVFGGPETPVTKTDVFEKLPFIDVIVKQEGEIAFADILENYSKDNILDIKGLLVNQEGKLYDTGASNRITDLSQIPSPYISGVFDKIIKDNPIVTWNPTIETNRGCPYQCTFCDWGSLTYNKIKNFDLERVFDEIEWIGKNHCEHVTISDANFGIFLERDEMIVDKIIETQQKYGFPYRIVMSWAKNQKSHVIKLANKLYGSGLNNGLIVSVQSMDDNVLTNIKRKNLEINKLTEVFNLCNSAGIAVSTELILGLPGETKKSWKNNIYKLLEINQHSGMEFWQAQLLENSEMNIKQRTYYKIDTVVVYDYLAGTDDYDSVPEGLEIVKSTRDLPLEDMIECLEFTWFMNTFHMGGISQWYSRFLNKLSGISYEEFYTGLQSHMMQYDWWKQEQHTVTQAYRSWLLTGMLQGKDSSELKIHDIKIHGWNHIHVTKLRMNMEHSHDLYFEAVHSYVKKQYQDILSDLMLQDLLSISNAFVIRHDKINTYPVNVKLYHNIIDFVLGTSNFKNNETNYEFSFPEDNKVNMRDFLLSILFRRRRNYGKSQIKVQELLI